MAHDHRYHIQEPGVPRPLYITSKEGDTTKDITEAKLFNTYFQARRFLADHLDRDCWAVAIYEDELERFARTAARKGRK